MNPIHAVTLDTFPGWKTGGEAHSFLERYGERQGPDGSLLTPPPE